MHNIRAATRSPAPVVTTADHDDRVVPGHSFKFTATLQAAQAGPQPGLIEIETKAGHGGGKPPSKVIGEEAHPLALLVCQLAKTASYVRLSAKSSYELAAHHHEPDLLRCL